MQKNACLPGFVLFPLPSVVRLCQGVSEFRNSRCGSEALQGRKRRSFVCILFKDLIDYEPHPYACHRLSSAPVFKKVSSVGWYGGTCQGVEGEEYVNNLTKNTAPKDFHSMGAYVKAKKKRSPERNTALWASCMQIYLCTHLCWNRHRSRSLTSIYWRWSKLSITWIAAVKPVF